MQTIKNFNFFGDEARFEHIGIAIRNINSVSNDLKKINDKIQNVNLSFINCNGLIIELVEPVDKDSPIKSYLNKKQSYYHICFSVPNLEHSIKHAKRHNFIRISKPVPAIAFQNRKIVWLFHSDFGLVELLER